MNAFHAPWSTCTNTDSRPKRGLLVIGHGTRDRQGQQEFFEQVEMIRQEASTLHVAAGFLELAEPTIDEGVARLLAAGAQHIDVAPLLLFAAGHAKRDIPQAVGAAARDRAVTVRQLPALEYREQMLALSARRFEEQFSTLDCRGPDNPPPGRKVLLLLVGRGSSDRQATGKMIRFAELRAASMPGLTVQTCFCAMAKPRLVDALRAAGDQGYGMVVVQPHLLFQGDLLGQIQRAVSDAAQQAPETEWVVTRHLGPAAEVAGLIAEMAEKSSEPSV